MCEHNAKLFNFENLWSILRQIKNLENQYRTLINRTFKLKTVQFTGLPFRNQEFAGKIDQKLKKLDKSIKF